MRELSLESIAYVGEDVYVVGFREEHGMVNVRCRIFDDGTTVGVQPFPDVFQDGLVPAREVTAAVVAFHRARLAAK